MKNKWLGYVAGIGLLGACSTEVDLCYGDHPHRSSLDLRFDWAADNDKARPDSMYVVALRPVNQLKYGFRVTSAPDRVSNQVEGVLLFPESERVDKNGNTSPVEPENPETSEGTEDTETTSPDGSASASQTRTGETESAPEQDRLWMRNGKYMLAAFNGTSTAFESSLNDFAGNEYATLDDLQVRYKIYATPGELPGAAKYRHWMDKNPYAGYVQDNVEPLFYATNSSFEVPVSAKASSKVVCRFAPRRMTQQVNIQFNIVKKEEGIRIDSVQAEMSGVASAIQLSNGNLTTDQTYKLLFSPACSRTDGMSQMQPIQVRGKINVTGLICNNSASLQTGPGIMHVNIYTTVEGESGTCVRVFKAGINLYRLLHKTPSVAKDARTGLVKQTRRDLTLSITAPLEMTRDQVLDSKVSGVDNWVFLEKLDLEI